MKIDNRAVFHDYTILSQIEAGVKLTGPEVKSAKMGHVSLKGAFVKIIGSELYLVNAQIQPYTFARVESYDPGRTRKLLIRKHEAESLKTKIDSQGLSLVPLSMYIKHGLIKVEIGLARGKKQFEKREAIKKRDQLRELSRSYRKKVT